MKKVENKGNYLNVVYSEPYQLDTFIALIKEVAETCRAGHCNQVLVDLREMPGKIGTMDRFQLGVAGANAFRGLAKVAIVYRKEEMNWFAETVGVNRGATVRVFSGMNDAMNWLGLSE